MSSSWSNLPLNILIIIRDKLQNSDLSSFCSICFQWHYASPIPNPCPRHYFVSLNNENIIMKSYLEDGSTRKHFISLPFSFSSHIYFGNSNGWLVFEDYKNKSLHLFDPVSNRKFILPPLNAKLLRYYKKVKSIVHDAYDAFFGKVVVSSSLDEGIAAAGIVEIANRKNRASPKPDRRLIFYRQGYGDRQRWSLLMEGSKGIIDICPAGDGRFYALGEDCELYMLDERPPLIKLKKIKLWLPKHILEPSSEKRIEFYGLEKSGETDLKVYGRCSRSNTFGMEYISLKINVTKLNGYSNNIEAACDAKWSYWKKILYSSEYYFTPLFKEHH